MARPAREDFLSSPPTGHDEAAREADVGHGSLALLDTDAQLLGRSDFGSYIGRRLAVAGCRVDATSIS